MFLFVVSNSNTILCFGVELFTNFDWCFFMVSFDSNRTFSMKELSWIDLISFNSCGYQSSLLFLQFNGSCSEFPRVLSVFSDEGLFGFSKKYSCNFNHLINL